MKHVFTAIIVNTKKSNKTNPSKIKQKTQETEKIKVPF